MKEEYLLTGPLESTNRSYAIAKIAGVEMCSAYNRQYGTQFLAAMPTNLYGPGDNYDLETSHVLPALVRKMHESKRRGDAEVVIWGTGRPRREFLYSDDMADACVLLMSLPDKGFEQLVADRLPLINVGSGTDMTVRELAELIADVVEFSGKLRFDDSRPDGTPRKLLDSSRLAGLGWKSRISLEQGIALASGDFLRLCSHES
jgi:GDP-L-fucose synthase